MSSIITCIEHRVDKKHKQTNTSQMFSQNITMSHIKFVCFDGIFDVRDLFFGLRRALAIPIYRPRA